MQNTFLRLYIEAQNVWESLKGDDGQDLVEYGLVIVLVCLAATAGMGTLANGINNAMSNVASKLATYTS
jgi:pilus assembly protein Flp/PilA